MRTSFYNPSKLELNFANAVNDLTHQLEQKLDEGDKVIKTETIHHTDNPMVIFKIKDKEGDLHEVVVQFIQRPDHLVS